MLLKGRASLSDAELIAILIGSGTGGISAVELAKLILSGFNQDLNALGRATIKDLINYKGIGEAKAITIVAALELGRRRQQTQVKEKPKITSSGDAYNCVYGTMEDLGHEVIKVLMLNRNNSGTKIETVSIGGVAGTVVDPKIVFKKALDAQASSIILCHNHPSGNLKPSQADLDLTKRLCAAGKTLDVNVLDHLIISDQGYFSFLDEGLV